ncbi:MAG: methionine--tRNA ligase [Acidobacteriota bacterium]|nr:methionine--tRNA ligase [Acidobacteriota bacterium]MDH3784020.1 methionine--tRNA ligase [Acidobacteriota bacterium]
MNKRRHLITSGLPYSNGRLHVGHIGGAYLPADTYVRYLRARGEEVRFVCGSDDNGVASLISARKEGRPVEELTAHYNRRQAADFEGLGIRFDIFGGTHQREFVEQHERFSQEFFLKIHEKGYFTKRTSSQLYDVEAKQFLPDRYVKGRCYHDGADGTPCQHPEAFGDQCESCGNAIDPTQLGDPVSTITGTRPELRDTTHWYLRLQDFEEPLRKWLESHRAPQEGPAWRETVLNFILGQIKQGLPERAMTRDLDWGIPVPLDDPDAEGKVLYVWFDAPIGYVSFTAELCRRLGESTEDYSRWWKDPDCKIVHFIGEDNTVFHALIWPAMLMAEGSFQLPSNVVANAFVNIKFPGQEEQKISKSRGTAIWVEEYLKQFAPDPLRYYLTTIAPESQRTTFDLKDFAARNNGELVNALGNFIHRSLTFTIKNFEGRVPEIGSRDEVDLAHLAEIEERHAAVTKRLEAFQFRTAIAEIMALARAANGYLDTKAPWKQRKTDLAACGSTMNICLQTVRALATLMAPFMPFSATRVAEMLAISEELSWESALDDLPAGQALGEPEILFEKLDLDLLFPDSATEETGGD